MELFKYPCREYAQSPEKRPPEDPLQHNANITVLEQFCKSTSIKGVPKIYTSELKYVKVLWAVAVTSFLSIALFQAHSLVHMYLQYNTVLRSQRYYYSERDSPESQWFPAMTICDLQYSWLDMHSQLLAFMRQYGIPSSSEFSRQYEEAWNTQFNNSHDFDTADRYPTHFVNMETLGAKSLLLKSLTISKFVPHCKLLVTGLFKRNIDCKNYVNVSLLPVFDYQTCVRVDLNLSAAKALLKERGYSVYGISLLLYASRQTGDNTASGGVIYHHNPGTQPNVYLDRSSLTVSPGQQYTIQHEEAVVKRRNTTKLTCANPEVHYQDISGITVNYSTVSTL